MILVDTSIWIDHLRAADVGLTLLLEQGAVLAHPWITGELALGNLANRHEVLRLLNQLSPAVVAGDAEILQLIDSHVLAGTGIGYVDAQLIAATLLTDGASLWTRDRRLVEVAVRLGIAAAPPISG